MRGLLEQTMGRRGQMNWITLKDDTELKDGLYLITTTDGRVDIAEFSNEPKLYEWDKKGICIGCASYWNIPDEILAVTPFEPYTKKGGSK